MKHILMRSLAFMMSLLMLVGVATACGKSDEVTEDPAATTTTVQGEATTTAPAEEQVVITRENYPDSLPEDLKFSGKTFKFMVRGDSGRRDEFIADEITGDIINDATLGREQSVEDRFDIEIEWVEVLHENVVTGVRAALNSGMMEFDLLAAETDHIVTLGAEGFFMNWIDAPYIDYEKPWWNPESNMVDSLSINGKLYGITGDISRLFVQKHFVCYFNKEIMENYPTIPNLYDLVLEGKWTLDKMTEYGALVKEDLNGNQQMDTADRYGFASYYATPFDNWIIALGQNVVTKNAEGVPEFRLDDPDMVELCELLTEIYNSDTTCLSPGNRANTTKFFAEGHCLFTVGGFEWASGMRDMTNDFGMIPYPKLNEDQEGYYTGYSDVGASCVAIAKIHPDQEFACAVTEALAAESYRKVTTAYFETALKEKYSRDSQSSQMLDMIREGIVFDFGFFYGSQLSDCDTMMRAVISGGKNNYASIYKSFSKVYAKRMSDLLSKFS
ncbi:MAG: extracellular solute-binding protein [Clostridia bacterium]|nr:extracellular solute-binding protein [Clostridia bacterium]